MSNKQCEYITQKGTRCSRKSEPGSKYCWQHEKLVQSSNEKKKSPGKVIISKKSPPKKKLSVKGQLKSPRTAPIISVESTKKSPPGSHEKLKSEETQIEKSMIVVVPFAAGHATG